MATAKGGADLFIKVDGKDIPISTSKDSEYEEFDRRVKNTIEKSLRWNMIFNPTKPYKPIKLQDALEDLYNEVSHWNPPVDLSTCTIGMNPEFHKQLGLSSYKGLPVLSLSSIGNVIIIESHGTIIQGIRVST